ncbi:MAG: hypothetical protein JNM56_15745 [Planctomycetia bacterium]|nr:hypothetical protein [Planctomycetia bacterium]
MATIRLDRQEAETAWLPAKCMCCGAGNVRWRTQPIEWKPGWVGWLLALPLGCFALSPWLLGDIRWLKQPLVGLPCLLIVAATSLTPYFVCTKKLQRRLHLAAPLCPKHWYHWQWRSVGIPVSMLALLMNCTTGSMLFRPMGAVSIHPCMPLHMLLGLVWLIAVSHLHRSMIQATAMDEQSVTLENVHPYFVEKVDRQRQAQLAQVQHLRGLFRCKIRTYVEFLHYRATCSTLQKSAENPCCSCGYVQMQLHKC